MKKLITAFAISTLTVLTVPAFATDIPKPESIAEKMSFKLVRGVTNVVTAIAEIPKQTIYIGNQNEAPKSFYEATLGKSRNF